MSRMSRISTIDQPEQPKLPPIAKKTVARARSYDDDAFIKLFDHRGGRDIIIMDNNGLPLRSTSSQRRTIFLVGNLKPLLFMARNVVRDLDPSNDITFMRIRSNIGEVHMTLGSEFILIVVQRFKKKFGNTEA